jgi:hypothetical protein
MIIELNSKQEMELLESGDLIITTDQQIYMIVQSRLTESKGYTMVNLRDATTISVVKTLEELTKQVAQYGDTIVKSNKVKLTVGWEG